MAPREVKLRKAKDTVLEALPPGHPGREAILAQPDEMDLASFDGIVRTLVHLLRMRIE